MNLRQIVLQTLARGHGYDKMSANPPSHDQQMVMAEDELNGMTHSEFLECLSSALDEMFPTEEK